MKEAPLPTHHQNPPASTGVGGRAVAFIWLLLVTSLTFHDEIVSTWNNLSERQQCSVVVWAFCILVVCMARVSRKSEAQTTPTRVQNAVLYTMCSLLGLWHLFVFFTPIPPPIRGVFAGPGHQISSDLWNRRQALRDMLPSGLQPNQTREVLQMSQKVMDEGAPVWCIFNSSSSTLHSESKHEFRLPLNASEVYFINRVSSVGGLVTVRAQEAEETDQVAITVRFGDDSSEPKFNLCFMKNKQGDRLGVGVLPLDGAWDSASEIHVDVVFPYIEGKPTVWDIFNAEVGKMKIQVDDISETLFPYIVHLESTAGDISVEAIKGHGIEIWSESGTITANVNALCEAWLWVKEGGTLNSTAVVDAQSSDWCRNRLREMLVWGYQSDMYVKGKLLYDQSKAGSPKDFWLRVFNDGGGTTDVDIEEITPDANIMVYSDVRGSKERFDITLAPGFEGTFNLVGDTPEFVPQLNYRYAEDPTGQDRRRTTTTIVGGTEILAGEVYWGAKPPESDPETMKRGVMFATLGCKGSLTL